MPLTDADFAPTKAPQAPPEASLTTSQAQAAPVPQQAPQGPPRAVESMGVDPQTAPAQRAVPTLAQTFERAGQDLSGLPEFLQPLAAIGLKAGQVMSERVLDPGARTVQRLGMAGFGLPDDQNTLSAGVTDLGTLASAAMAPGVVGMSMAADVAGRVLTGDEDTGRWLGSLAEIGSAAGNVVKVGRQAFTKGKALLKGRTGSVPTKASMGSDLKTLIPTALRQRGAVLGGNIKRLENQYAAASQALDTTQPSYSLLRNSLDEVFTMSDELPGTAGELVSEIHRRTRMGLPISPATLVEAKHKLVMPARAARGQAEPAMNAAAFSKARAAITNAIQNSMDPALARDYQSARTLYANEVGIPRRILSSAFSDTTSPLKLFNSIFTGTNPHRAQAAMEVAKNNPALKAKLAVGYLENLGVASNGWQDSRKALAALRNTKGLALSNGLVSPEDMRSLEFFLQRNSLPNMIEGMQSIMGTAGGAFRATAATSAAYFLSGKPSHALAAMVASGSLPALRRAMLIPEGHPARKKAALVIMNNVNRLATDVAGATRRPQPGEEELREVNEPVAP